MGHFTRWTNLRCVRLWGTRLTDTGVDELAELKHLQQLDLNDTAVTTEGLARLRAALPHTKISGNLDR